MPRCSGWRLSLVLVRVLTTVILSWSLLLGSQAAAAIDFSKPLAFDIPPQGLSSALVQFSDQAGVQFAAPGNALAGVRTGGVHGELSTSSALRLLLKDTGFSYRLIEEGTVAISRSPDPPRSESAPQASVEQPEQLEEIIVTAQKRAERLLDTPQSVSVVSADDIAKLGATQFRDFANTLPGVTFSTSGIGYNQITMRGITSGYDISQTVGIYVDDVPYGGSSAFVQGSHVSLDVGLADVERIEVLRGPQGTLYGASTMGGLIKYVSKTPDAINFKVDTQASVSGTEDGSVNYNGYLAVNAPLIADKAALRASAFYSRDGGFIDDVALDRNNVNSSSVYGGRLDLMLTPVEGLSIRLNGFLQDIYRNGQATADYTLSGPPEFGRLEQSRLAPEPFHQQFRLISATVKDDFGWGQLTSITSYQWVRALDTYDYTAVFGPLLQAILHRSYSSVSVPNPVDTDKLTQELRLGSIHSEILEWLVGGFFNHEISDQTQSLLLRGQSGQLLANDLFTSETPSKYKEYAGFADLTYHITQAFDVSGGMRYSHDQQSFLQNGSGLLVGSEPRRESSENVLTYLANARYHFTPNATGYVRFATGYRPGGPNYVTTDPATGISLAPLTFQADKLKSYEAGIKAETPDRRYAIDVDGYFIKWNNIQIATSVNGFSDIANAPGGATVRGTELTLSARPLTGLAMTGTFAYTDAHLTQADVDLGAAAGEQLPNVPKYTGSLNADYVFGASTWRPTAGTTLRYVSNREASFDHSAGFPQYALPSYTALDLRAGLSFRSADLQLYVRNLFDNHGQLSAATNRGPLAQVAILQPLTVGVSVSTHF